MNNTVKRYIKLFVPPIVFKLTPRVRYGNSIKVVSLGDSPDRQDINLYWDEKYADVLENWGKGSVWIEIDLLFSTLKGKVLDIACGTGTTIELLNKNSNLEVFGFDISDLLIKRAIQKGILPERLKVADATVKSYSENEFDYSFSIGSIEHFTEDGINLFLKNASFYTKYYSFHMLPVNKDGINKGWEKTEQSYFNNSIEWWMNIFKNHFSNIRVFDSTWAALDQQGKWFVCCK